MQRAYLRRPSKPHWRTVPITSFALVLGTVVCAGQDAGFSGGIPNTVIAPRPGLHLGRFEFHGGLFGTVAYDDFAVYGPDGQEDDITWLISPFGSVRTEGPNGRSLQASYQPGFLFFMDHGDENAINHSGTFDLNWPLNRLTLRLTERASVASVVVRDVGNREMQTSFVTEGMADYQMSHLTSLHGNVNYTRTVYEADLFSSQQFSEQFRADYKYNEKLTLGAGAMFNQLFVENSPNQFSEGPFVMASSSPYPGLTLQAHIGVLFQQYETSDAGTVAPTYRISAAYQIRPGTSVTLEASRSEQPSALSVGQNYSNTQVSAMLNQALWKKFTATLGVGYSFADYYATEEGVSTDRTDNYYFIRSSLGYSLGKAWGMGLFFDHTSNSSDGEGSFDYDHNVVGFQASWSF